jgi:acyl dehydratase
MSISMSSNFIPSEKNSSPAQGIWSRNFCASYTTKDIVQYALALGFGSTNVKEDLKYTFEESRDFQAIPTFLLILINWATTQSDGSFTLLPNFPTELMKHMGVIPPENLQCDDIDLNQFPVLHISQSIHWHQNVPMPINQSRILTLISSRVVSLMPKSIGTFVETETRIRRSNGELLCSLSATTLVLGIPPSRVVPYTSEFWNIPTRITYPSNPPDFTWLFSIAPNQALLYRISSGDTNRIHVEPHSLPNTSAGSTHKPILHGSCTLGIAMRGLVQFVDHDYSIISLRADFSNPVYIDDSLRLEVWNVSPQVKLFRVVKVDSNTVVVDNAILKIIPAKQSRSKL